MRFFLQGDAAQNVQDCGFGFYIRLFLSKLWSYNEASTVPASARSRDLKCAPQHYYGVNLTHAEKNNYCGHLVGVFKANTDEGMK